MVSLTDAQLTVTDDVMADGRPWSSAPVWTRTGGGDALMSAGLCRHLVV